MTDRKFTPPTEFPAEYVTSDGRKAVILGRMPSDVYPLVYPFAGYVLDKDGDCPLLTWTKGGASYETEESDIDLHDLPKKQVRWANDYGEFPRGSWFHNREEADNSTADRRIAVIRREWVEGKPPQYFSEEV